MHWRAPAGDERNKARTPAVGQIFGSPAQLLSLGVEGSSAEVMILLEDQTGGENKIVVKT